MIKAKQPLQAILLADSFTNFFRPATLDVPKVLFPLVNVPMIEYTLEWLASNKVEEVRIPVNFYVLYCMLMHHYCLCLYHSPPHVYLSLLSLHMCVSMSTLGHVNPLDNYALHMYSMVNEKHTLIIIFSYKDICLLQLESPEDS